MTAAAQENTSTRAKGADRKWEQYVASQSNTVIIVRRTTQMPTAKRAAQALILAVTMVADDVVQAAYLSAKMSDREIKPRDVNDAVRSNEFTSSRRPLSANLGGTAAPADRLTAR
ncbi:hypothetical protein [Catenulispora pinisilvae]|uniref:hypothetical protein n=1 Tax=Catenulispora pinisilvae TaxID=2705253 RepID=UPI001890FCF9|nr:hypothetical protein [Catenulispora pinisilvae]